MDKQKFQEIRSRWFTPVQMLELDACSRCQECIRICPVVRADIPEGAMERIEAWQQVSTQITGIFSKWRSQSGNDALLTHISRALARCTSCGACAIVCESGISTAPLWESMRGACMELGYREPVAEKNAMTILTRKNPYDGEMSDRTSWIPATTLIENTAEIGFFPGCTIAYRNQDLGKAALRILNTAGIPFCMLGNDEFCCGSFLFRTGFEDAYADTIRGMIETLKNRGVKTLLVSCAGCLKTMTLDWPRIYGKKLPFELMSFSVFIRDLIKEQKITFRTETEHRVIYHDPCHAGRHLMHNLGRDQVFEAPRDVLTSIPGVSLIECAENREFQSCCGAGGGLKAEDPKLAHKIASRKLEEIDSLHADILATTCPFCERNLKDSCDELGISLKILDIIECIDRTMEKRAQNENV